MPTKSHRAIGSLEFSDAERRKLAKNSKAWRCETCGPIKDLLKQPEDPSSNNNICESAGSSRVKNGSQLEEQSDRKSLSSDSEGENRDSLTDSQKTSTSTNGSDSEGSGSSIVDNISNGIPRSASDEHDNAKTAAATQLRAGTDVPQKSVAINSEQNLNHERRRSYPSLVFISISVLLFLLILRRVVMIVQELMSS